MLVLASTLFGPQFPYSQHFEQRNCSLPRFLYDTQFFTMSFKWLHVFIEWNSVFQPAFRGTSGFREWLPGVPLKQTEFAWDEIRNHSSRRL